MKGVVLGLVLSACLWLPAVSWAACSVSSTAVNFGAYDVFSPAPLDTSGTVTISCDEAPPPDVTIAIGPSAFSGGFFPRRMKHSSRAEFINYNLYTDSTMTVIWGNGTSGTSTVVEDKVKKNEPPRVRTIYARIPFGQDVSVGAYSDTLTVTITW